MRSLDYPNRLTNFCKVRPVNAGQNSFKKLSNYYLYVRQIKPAFRTLSSGFSIFAAIDLVN